MPGLKLNDLLINRISGPTSITFLKPTRSSLTEFQKIGIELPIILLFGDIHHSVSGTCNNCVCEEKSEE